MRWGRAAVVGVATMLLLSAATPADSANYWVVVERDGWASHSTWPRSAQISFRQVDVDERRVGKPESRNPRVCIVFRDSARRLQASGCGSAPFTTADDLRSARVVGSLKATIRNGDTGAEVGTTTFRYDVQLTTRTYIAPGGQAHTGACRLAGGEVVTGTTTGALGSARGIVSSPTMGTVRFGPPWATATVRRNTYHGVSWPGRELPGPPGVPMCTAIGAGVSGPVLFPPHPLVPS